MTIDIGQALQEIYPEAELEEFRLRTLFISSRILTYIFFYIILSLILNYVLAFIISIIFILFDLKYIHQYNYQ